MSIFDPESKFMLYIRVLGDMITLNVLFILCSIPVFTIGAAQAGLYTGLRELFDRDSSNSPSRSFFKGFKNGFVKISAMWTSALVVIALLSYSVYFLYHAIEKHVINTNVPIIIALVGLVVFIAISAELTLFHSQFDCNPMLLFRNTMIMVVSHPLRNLIIGISMWIPLILALFAPSYFFLLTPLWFGVYFSIVGYMNISLMKKPFEKIIYPNGKPEEKEEEEIEEPEDEY